MRNDQDITPLGVTIRLLGAPCVVDREIGRGFPTKGFQLLALLCRRLPHVVKRSEAAALLWSDRPDADALANLRQLLARFRDLEPVTGALVAAERETISLGLNRSAIDLVAFETLAAARPGGLMLRLRLFGGDLLAGLDNVSAEFAEWLAPERLSLRESFFAIASEALTEITRYGHAPADEITAIAARMLAIDGAREATYRALIDAYGRCGCFEEADRLVRQLRDVLQREFGAEPSRETAAVVRRVFADAKEPLADAVGGRADEARARVAILAPLWLRPDGPDRLIRALIEDVANELSRYRSFAVLAPESTFRIGNEFGRPIDNGALLATHVVSGFIKPGAGADRLALRMVHADTGEIRWAAEFPIDVADLAGLFRATSLRIASSIAAEIERNLLAESRRSSAAGAYGHYLDGQADLKSCDLRMLRRARAAFKAAVQADDGFAAAHARIAQTLYLEWLALGGDDPSILRAARERAELAVRRDQGAPLGHLMTGVVALYQRDFDHSGEKFAEAEALSPNSADLLVEHADALAYFGEAKAGWLKFERATELNPLAQDHHWWAGASIAFNGGDYARAIDLCGRVESQDTVLRLLAASHAQIGDADTARRYGVRLKEQFPGKSAVDHVKLAPFRNAGDLQPLIEGLRMAGVS